MKRLYETNELTFALIWIGVYVVLFSLGDVLSAQLGIEKLVTAIIGAVLMVASYIWVLKNGLAEKYGLCPMKKSVREYLYFIPLLIMLTVNLWYGVHFNLTVLETALYIFSMLCVGFLEELIFRGFLFKALCKDDLKQAIIISSLTFGIGHIVNLLNGADVLATLLQVCYAVAIGFLFTYIFHTSGSLWVCIVTHGIFNSLSVFSGDVTTPQKQLISAGFLCVLCIGYSVYLIKRFRPTQDE